MSGSDGCLTVFVVILVIVAAFTTGLNIGKETYIPDEPWYKSQPSQVPAFTEREVFESPCLRSVIKDKAFAVGVVLGSFNVVNSMSLSRDGADVYVIAEAETKEGRRWAQLQVSSIQNGDTQIEWYMPAYYLDTLLVCD